MCRIERIVADRVGCSQGHLSAIGTTERIHWSFDDPTAVTGTDEQKLRAFRTVRDAIQQRLRMFLIIANKK